MEVTDEDLDFIREADDTSLDFMLLGTSSILLID
jgi:hypothetical protein